jgi:hypothetical protein
MLVLVGAALSLAGLAGAQQVTGRPGSPSATTTIPGNQLPPPPMKFGGVINEKAVDSKPFWPPMVVPKKGAPNVLLIMKDDGGFGKGGLGTLYVDGEQVDSKRMENSGPFIFQWDETFDVGMDTGTPVDFLEYRYDTPFHFTGTLNKLTFNLQPQQLTAEERRIMQIFAQRNNRASE